MATTSAIDVPFDRKTIDSIIAEKKIDLTNASIREMVLLVGEIERRLSCRYLRMEFGIPGLTPNALVIEAEKKALLDPRFAATYPPITGLPALKEAGSRFVKQFLNLEIAPEFVIPTVGSMQGGFLSQAVSARRKEGKDKILFIDPCFSVHRMQTKFLGLQDLSVDLYDRATWLDRTEALVKKGDVGGVLYSSPNNPTWVILTEEELKRLGEICTRYDVVAIEDAAYFGMDFRKDYSVPGEPPYPPTIARYTDHFVLLISSSKIFSYAGQRAAIAVLSPKLAIREFPGLERHSGYKKFFDAFVMSGVYCTTSGVSASPQIGLAALLNAASDGKLDFVEDTKEYAERAKLLKKIFTDNGFVLVYDKDGSEPISDGFYFTIAYPGMDAGKLAHELLCYGVSATTLAITRSERKEALRACVSLISRDQIPLFDTRIRAFRRDQLAG